VKSRQVLLHGIKSFLKHTMVSPLDIPEILALILSFVDGRTLSRCARVNKAWHEEVRRINEKPRSRSLLVVGTDLHGVLQDLDALIGSVKFIPDVAMLFVSGLGFDLV